VGGRPFLYYDVPIGLQKVGDFEVDSLEIFKAFFISRSNLHAKLGG
jgi:imidazoleglycerol phosphate dehydratase HisB